MMFDIANNKRIKKSPVALVWESLAYLSDPSASRETRSTLGESLERIARSLMGKGVYSSRFHQLTWVEWDDGSRSFAHWSGCTFDPVRGTIWISSSCSGPMVTAHFNKAEVTGGQP